MVEEIAKPLDLRLLEGDARQKPLEYSFNYLRGLINSRTNICWKCHNLSTCHNLEHIKRCSKIKLVIQELKTKGLFYEKV